MLKGTMQVLEDREVKKEFWKDEFDVYYKGGMDGGDFTLIKFTAQSGRYYSDFHSEDFSVE
jgi:general stress protein 26